MKKDTKMSTGWKDGAPADDGWHVLVIDGLEHVCEVAFINGTLSARIGRTWEPVARIGCARHLSMRLSQKDRDEMRAEERTRSTTSDFVSARDVCYVSGRAALKLW